jgi:hypothetical protein
MWPAGNWSRKVREISQNSFGATSTYRYGSVAVEGAGIDLHISTTIGTNSSALEVACPPPGHRRKFRKFMLTITHPLT